jgi:hypothetical protein
MVVVTSMLKVVVMDEKWMLFESEYVTQRDQMSPKGLTAQMDAGWALALA